MKKLILYWKNTEIGTLTESNWDMRSGGDIVFKHNYLSEEHKNNQLSNYIRHSIQANIYLMNGDETNYQRMCKEEIHFLDLINSTEWKIEDNYGERRRILCPVFLENYGITWQRYYDKT